VSARETVPSGPGFLTSLRAFLADFGRYAGRDAVYAGALLAAGAVVDSLGLALLIPVLGVLAPATPGAAGLHRAAARLFQLAGAQTPLAQLAVLLGLYGLLMIGRGLVVTRRDVKLAQLQIGFLEAQRNEVARLLAAAPWERLARLRHARISNLMSGDLQRIGGGVNALLQSGVSAAMLAAQCALLLVLSPALAAIALALLLMIALALAPMIRRSQRLGRYVSGANLSLIETTSQFLGGLKLAISQDLQGAFTREFRDTLRALTNRQVDAVRERTRARLAISLLSSAVGGAVVFVGFGVLHTPAAVLITAIVVIARMGGPAGQIQQAAQQLAFALPAHETVLELKRELAAAAETLTVAGAAPFPDGAVIFEDVSFLHPESTDAAAAARGVRGLDLTLRPGDFVGVVGPSGAGKTTFADLLVGLISPQSGRISVGGRRLEGATLAAWRRGIAYVSQDPFLFHDTVRRNLAWANPTASEPEMWRALAVADAEALVRGMDGGLDGVVGERGTLVSGGERQRIALARALLRQPRLLVLDEAANALDPETERAILARLAALADRPTIVMIAHRSESLAPCRTVLRFEAGALVIPATASAPRRDNIGLLRN
jgi:ATP-binding cassette subfamily C protein